VLLILILSRNSIYPNIWFSHALHYHSSWKIKKTCLKEIILNASYFKNIRQLYKFIVLPQELTYVVKHHSKGKKSYTKNEVISMLEFLIYNIFVEFGCQFFSANLWHSYRDKLCPSHCRSFQLLIWVRIYAKAFMTTSIY
jgi:hypothetical protein